MESFQSRSYTDEGFVDFGPDWEDTNDVVLPNGHLIDHHQGSTIVRGQLTPRSTSQYVRCVGKLTWQALAYLETINDKIDKLHEENAILKRKLDILLERIPASPVKVDTSHPVRVGITSEPRVINPIERQPITPPRPK